MRRWAHVAMLSVAVSCTSAPRAKPQAAAVESPPTELPYCTPSGMGIIQGVVRDQASSLPISDVTVVATSPALEGSAFELTDSQGMYLIANLPPGDYELVFYYGEIKTHRANVTVGGGKVTPLPIKIEASATGGRVVDIPLRGPLMDGGLGPGPRDPNAPHGGRLWADRGVTLGQDYRRDATAPAPPPAPPKCRPRPAETTPAPADPRGQR